MDDWEWQSGSGERKRRWLRLLVVVVLIIVGLVAVLIVGAIRSPNPSTYLQTAASPVATPGATAPPLTLYDFESEGDTDFPTVYTGAVHEHDGSITFYVTKRDPKLLAAIAAANPTHIRYRFVIVPYSFKEEDRVTMGIAHDGKQLMREGVRLVEWGPNPRTSLVIVHLQKPQVSDLKALAAARDAPLSEITVKTYPAQVEALLKSRFGPGLQVSSEYEEPAIFD